MKLFLLKCPCCDLGKLTKINENGTEFKKNEIAMIKRRYHLTCDQVDRIFFAD